MSLREIIWLGKMELKVQSPRPNTPTSLLSALSHPGWSLLMRLSNPSSPTSGLPLSFMALDVPPRLISLLASDILSNPSFTL